MKRSLVFAFFAVSLSWAGPADQVRKIYHEQHQKETVPLILEAIQFPTVAHNGVAWLKQQDWLRKLAARLGFTYRDAGPMAEIELPAVEGSPVLGLVLHGDVQPPGEGWTSPPFSGVARDGSVYGRGAVDDKGPLIQALLALASFRESRLPRTHTVRLLIGSNEESSGSDMKDYLQTRPAPDYSLVLDSEFPVVIREKAWDELTVTAASPYVERESSQPWTLAHLDAGVATSIVPNRATASLRWRPESSGGYVAAVERIRKAPVLSGYRLETNGSDRELTVTVHGKAAHSGSNIEGGRNALVFLANLLKGEVNPCGARDLLEFAAMAGHDLYGTGLGLSESEPGWGRYSVNVARIAPLAGGALRISINLRRTPPRDKTQIRSYLEQRVTDFNQKQKAALLFGGYFEDEPLQFNPDAPLVKRLLAAYQRVTGLQAKPAVSGGSTYAKRLPNSIAFGMWFPGSPYPGHDVDEHIAIADLHRGVDVLIEALVDLAGSPPFRPFRIGPE